MGCIRRTSWLLIALAVAVSGCKGPPPTVSGAIAKEPNELFWGDTYVHRSSTADASLSGHRSVDPNTAYRWARGIPVVDPYTKAKDQLETALDFMVVADQAEVLAAGTSPAITDSDDEALEQAAWSDIVEAAERNYQACAFTTFIGWEWTSEAGGQSLTRVVIMDEGGEKARELVPFSSLDGRRPEDLSSWLEETSERVGTDFVAIPHNSNLSGGTMFPELDSEGRLVTADSEGEAPTGAAGLEHSALSTRGLTAAWAEENTRASIFRAFERREVYATTGPRIRVRVFGGWGFDGKQAKKANMVTLGYTAGHPMGSELSKGPKGKAPGFMMYAVKDPEGANLDRIQLVKDWVDAEGKTHERVYDVVWSDDRERDADGKLPAVKNVELQGAPSLHGFWSDPDFDHSQRAFYSLRVLQIPTPRYGADPNETGQPATIQERAYTSPIRYTP